MEEWKTYRLEDLTIDGKGHYGIGAPAVDYDENKFTYLRITDINDDGSLNYSGLKSVDDPEASKYLLQEGDIVFARTGNSTGRSYYYEPSDGQFVFAGFLIKFSLDPTKVNPRFLKYYTHSKMYYEWVQSFDTGATRGNINAQTFGSMEINLPPREVQDRLVEILRSIDDKIKLNNHINHNLEEQARALYKSWFVDFEPFKGGKFVDSELGMIPEGWTVAPLGCIATISSGKRPPFKSTVQNEEYKIPVLGASSVMAYTSEYLIEGLYIITGRVGTLGELQRVKGKIWPSDNTLVISSDYYNFVYQVLREVDYSSLNRGSTQPLLTQSDLKSWPIVLPPEDVLNRFESCSLSLTSSILMNIEQNGVLRNVRDSILPVLMHDGINS